MMRGEQLTLRHAHRRNEPVGVLVLGAFPAHTKSASRALPRTRWHRATLRGRQHRRRLRP
jgi:hypothetical protein